MTSHLTIIIIDIVIDIVGYSAATLTALCWLPQAIKVLRERETRAILLPATAAPMTPIPVSKLRYG